jgi:hypothetical protein
MVTGTTPFPKENSREKIMAHLRSEWVDPCVFREDLPNELSQTIARMMAKDPAGRFQTMTEVQESLASWERGHLARMKDDQKAVASGLAAEPEHVVVGAETLHKLLEFTVQPHGKAEESFSVDTIDLAAVRDVPVEPEIYGLQKPDDERQDDFSFELPAGQIDEELPIRFDQKSLFEFVSTFEEATRIPYWKLDALSKLRRSLPLPFRLRFAKREVIIRRFARQMRNGYVLDPRCGGERSHVKAEPTLCWYLWWLLTAQPYDKYSDSSPPINTAVINETGRGSSNDLDSTTAPKEYVDVHLPGHLKSVRIEVPPVIPDRIRGDGRFENQNHVNTMGNWGESPPKIEYSGERSPRPFEPLKILFWLFVAIFGLVISLVIVGICAVTL